MILKEYTIDKQYTRKSKHGVKHVYFRKQSIVVLRCDNCSRIFERQRGKMDPKRINNNYFHVCNVCNSKTFAQKKGVERKQIWNLSASSDLDISKI